MTGAQKKTLKYLSRWTSPFKGSVSLPSERVGKALLKRNLATQVLTDDGSYKYRITKEGMDALSRLPTYEVAISSLSRCKEFIDNCKIEG